MATPYSVHFVHSARKEFERLPKKIQDRVVEALHLLQHNPRSELLKVKKLKGTDALYRIRLGDYRIVYDVRHEQLVIVVIALGHRREVYRHV